MACTVCGAPPLPVGGRCVFCRSSLDEGADAGGLLDYLAGRLPSADARRGVLGSGAVSDVRVVASGRSYRARLRRGALELEPAGEPAEWVERLLADLTLDAAGDRAVRSALAAAGWDWR
jgi:hypothetical protein